MTITQQFLLPLCPHRCHLFASSHWHADTGCWLEAIDNNKRLRDATGVKRGDTVGLGFKAFDAAQATLVGIELMHMIKKRQLVVGEGNEGRTAAEQFYALAA